MNEEEVVLRLITTGEGETVGALDATAAASARLRRETDAVGVSMARTAKRGFLMNQVIFTMRRLMYMGTLAIVGGTLALLDWGFKFNSTMQQGRVILHQFLGSTVLANRELDHLFNLAAYSPFQFQDLVKGAAVMYAFGFTTAQTNRTMQDLVDALTATGRATPGALNRVSQALGHMMSMGTATGQVLQQLARDGIPGVYKAVEKYFHLSPQQAHHIGALGLSSSDVLTAILQNIEHSKLHGIAKKMQRSTLKGVFTTFKDFASQIMGNIETRPFNWLQRTFDTINPALARMQKGFKKGGFGGMWDALTRGRPTGVERDLQLIGHGLSDIWRILNEGVIPAARQWFNVLKPILGLLQIATSLLGFLARNMWLTKFILFLIIGEWIRYRIIATAAFAATKYMLFYEAAAASAAFWKTLAINVYWFARYFWAVGTAVVANRAMILSQVRLRIATYAAAAAIRFSGIIDAIVTGRLMLLRAATWGVIFAQRVWTALIGLLTPAMVVIAAETDAFAASTATAAVITAEFDASLVAASISEGIMATASGVLATAMYALEGAMAFLEANALFIAFAATVGIFLLLRKHIGDLRAGFAALTTGILIVTAAAWGLDAVPWVLALSLVIITIYELIKNFDAIKTWMRNNAPIIAAAINTMFGPLGLVVSQVILLVKYWKQITGFFGGIFGSVFGGDNTGDKRSLYGNNFGGGTFVASPAAAAPFGTYGGVSPVATSSFGTYGNNRSFDFKPPSQSWLSQKTARDGIMPSITIKDQRQTHVTLEADGKKLAQVVADHRDDVRANQ